MRAGDMDFGGTNVFADRHRLIMGALVALLAIWFLGAPALASSVEDIRVDDDRIVIRFDGRVANASAFVLDGPQRIAVDISNATPGRSMRGGGLVTQVRQGQFDPDTARIVFDLSRPVIVTGGSFGKDGRTLTIDLRRVDARRFADSVSSGRVRFLAPFVRNAAREDRGVTVPVPAVARRSAKGLPRVYGGDETRPLVVIDAGHGGHDPGAISPEGNLREKDLTLKTALAIRDALVESGRVRVALTREDDRYLVLRERFGIARRLDADLFISIHCDSAANPDATGATAYTLSEVASDKEAALLATRENKADILAGVNLADAAPDISSILIDLTQRQTMNASANFARLLGREAQARIPTKDTFHRMASLMVLRAPDMPSILFETGYISNRGDAAFLNSRSGRAKIADSVRRAVEIHFARQMVSR